MTTNLHGIDLGVFQRYAGLSLPRHVSYPMPSWWTGFTADDARGMVDDCIHEGDSAGISLYLHIPFCEALCKFCACNKVVMRKTLPDADEKTENYLRALERDVRGVAGSVGGRPLRQLHWGGGSPTYLSERQIARLMEVIRGAFSVAADAEIAMEIDPRHSPPELLSALARLGFNRVSLGVQDFDAQVQAHVHRKQPFEQVRGVVETCRDAGIPSINFDLIYGLPYQTLETVVDTIQQTLTLSPDRVAYYHYAQIPDKIATQRGIHHERMPDSLTKLDMFLTGVQLFEAHGYEFIGLDHFAKSAEPLALALREGTLQRNFQGMTTGGGLDLFGTGVSAISHLRRLGFFQNTHDVDEYVRDMTDGGFPVRRGKRLTEDDRLRQALLDQLYCTAAIDPAPLEERFGIRFLDYFNREWTALEELAEDGLVAVDPHGSVHVTFPLGRVLMRNVAAVFDAYLAPTAYRDGAVHMFSANA